MQREPHRWQTVFGSWVQSYGVPRLASDLSAVGQPVTTFAVHKWVAGSHSPRPDRAAAMERLSRGSITIGDIYSHRAVVQREVGIVGGTT